MTWQDWSWLMEHRSRWNWGLSVTSTALWLIKTLSSAKYSGCSWARRQFSNSKVGRKETTAVVIDISRKRPTVRSRRGKNQRRKESPRSRGNLNHDRRALKRHFQLSSVQLVDLHQLSRIQLLHHSNNYLRWHSRMPQNWLNKMATCKMWCSWAIAAQPKM